MTGSRTALSTNRQKIIYKLSIRFPSIAHVHVVEIAIIEFGNGINLN